MAKNPLDFQALPNSWSQWLAQGPLGEIHCQRAPSCWVFGLTDRRCISTPEAALAWGGKDRGRSCLLWGRRRGFPGAAFAALSFWSKFNHLVRQMNVVWVAVNHREKWLMSKQGFVLRLWCCWFCELTAQQSSWVLWGVFVLGRCDSKSHNNHHLHCGKDVMFS